jgi:hypothetical protein
MLWAYEVRVHPRQARQAAARCHGLYIDLGEREREREREIKAYFP